MRTKDAILGTLNDARGWLDAWSAGFTDLEARSSHGAHVHPLAWHLGHVACTQDDVIRLCERSAPSPSTYGAPGGGARGPSSS